MAISKSDGNSSRSLVVEPVRLISSALKFAITKSMKLEFKSTLLEVGMAEDNGSTSTVGLVQVFTLASRSLLKQYRFVCRSVNDV